MIDPDARVFALAFALLCAVLGGVVHAADVATYALPRVDSPSQVYSLKVDGKVVPVVRYSGDYDYAHFSMGGGPASVEVTVNAQGGIRGYHISPRKLGIRGAVRGNTLRFTLPRDEYLIVKVEGVRALVIAADPAETDKPAASGEGIFNVLDERYRADRTGERLATDAIQRAIDDASRYGSEHGGQGVVYVPAGLYHVGNLVLGSNAAVYLEGGAVLRCTANRDDYRGHWFKNSMGADITWFITTAEGATNVKLYGRGTLDGNGWNLWEKSKKTRRMANNLLVPMHTSGFTCDGLVIRDSSAWSVVPVRSDRLVFTNLKLLNRLNMGENDGIDVVECQDVVVRNAIGIALDDPFSTKTWEATTDIARNWTGEPEAQRDVLIEDTISWTHCYGYKVGQGVLQDQMNITFRDGVVYDAAVGLGIHHKYGAATIRGVTFEDIDIERLHGTNEDRGSWLAFLVDRRNKYGGGPIRDVHVRNIRVYDAGQKPGFLKGLSEKANFDGVVFENITMPDRPTPAQNLHQMQITNRAFYGGVKVLPTQIDEPPKRTNLAYQRPTIASSSLEFPPERAVDGDTGTRWDSVQQSDPQWLGVDLGSPRSINGVKIVWEAAYARSYRVEVSDDGSRWRPVFSTNSGNGGADEIDFKPVTARYVRVFGTQRGSKYGYSIWEFEVYPTEEPGDPR